MKKQLRVRFLLLSIMHTQNVTQTSSLESMYCISVKFKVIKSKHISVLIKVIAINKGFIYLEHMEACQKYIYIYIYILN
jgi:hypothetical protein